MTHEKGNREPRPFLAIAVLILSALTLYFGYGKAFISIAYDPHEKNCLPDLHLALMVHVRPNKIARGEYLFWKAYGALSYVKEDFVLKKVAGIPGDKLLIKDGNVFINGVLVASGFDDAALYNKTAKDFEKEEVIPADEYFMMGTASLSNDSRYWGYLPKRVIVGEGYRIY